MWHVFIGALEGQDDDGDKCVSAQRTEEGTWKGQVVINLQTTFFSSREKRKGPNARWKEGLGGLLCYSPIQEGREKKEKRRTNITMLMSPRKGRKKGHIQIMFIVPCP